MCNFITKVKNEIRDTIELMRNVPSVAMVLFVISVVLMNLLANKEIYTGVSWLALDCGLTMSWLTFLCMDMLTKRFGPKASIKLSAVAAIMNLFVCLMLKIVSIIPGNWAEFYSFGDQIVNQSLNNTIGSTWYVLMGSTVAFIASAVVNAVLNHTVGALIKHDNFKSYAIRSYVSTLFAQFVDNFIFSIIVSHTFFGWTVLQCVTCSLTGCFIELICEIIFSPIGYRVCKKWEADKVGHEYVSKYYTERISE